MSSCRLGGSPLHPALIHFPIAAWTLALVGDGVYAFYHEPLWWQVAYWAIAAGVVTGLVAMVAGLIELAVIPDNHPAWRSAILHMTLMGGSWLLFTINLLLREPTATAQPTAFWLPPCLSLLAMVLLIVGGHYGARLVYHYGVGVSMGSKEG